MEANDRSIRLRSRSRAALFVTALAALGGCTAGDECSDCLDASVTDAALADASLPDALVPDAAGLPDADQPDVRPDAGADPDAGVRLDQSTCDPCSTGCPGGRCLHNPSTGESFCADRCDSDPSACVSGFTCYDIDQTTAVESYCIPPGSSCTMAGTGYGAECYGDTSACLHAESRCEGDLFATGYCTNPCLNDAACPPGYGCAPGDDGEAVCQPVFQGGAERCAREGVANEVPCALDWDCGALPGAVCVRSEPSLPGVCALPCPAGATCGAGTTCHATLRGPVCLTEACLCHAADVAAGTRDLLGEALEQVGLSRCGTLFDVHDWTVNAPDMIEDPYRLGFYDAVHNEPLRAPGWGREVVRSLDGDAALAVPVAGKAARMVEHLAALVDHPAIRHAPGTIDPVEPLATAVAALITDAGGTPDLVALRADASGLSMELQLALAEVVDAIGRAAEARREAVERAYPNAVDSLYQYGPAFVTPRRDGQGLSPTNATNAEILTHGFGYGEMYGGAVDVLDAMAHADLARFREVPTTTTATTAHLLFSADTPLGRIAVGGSESGTYDERAPGFGGAWALLVDLGGDDTYRIPVAGNVSRANAVSVMIDLGGDDDYGYVEVPNPRDGARLPSDAGGRYFPTNTPARGNGPISLSEVPRQGGARLGTAILVDLGQGRDRYRSLRLSQGAGVLGTGVLVDDGGDDVYLAEVMAQGAGAFGIGLLYDAGGNDERRAYEFAQGFGFAKAAGLLYDASGNDAYLMDVGDPSIGGDPLYFSAQRPGTGNSSLGQGFGFGRRADTSDRAFMSGGLGILVDAAGDDRYEASVFAQGGGYWFGTGILADESGNDRYDALWYAMGTGAHYALGVLLEGGGNDVYGGTFPRINVTIGGGHDYSAAFLIDESGDDVYDGSNITVGAGNSTGMGFFVDNGGNDTYRANSDYSFGNAGLLEAGISELGSPRRAVDVIGVFLDAGGLDTYERGGATAMGLGDDEAWVQTKSPDPIVQRIERGTGVDGVGETTLHARWP